MAFSTHRSTQRHAKPRYEGPDDNRRQSMATDLFAEVFHGGVEAVPGGGNECTGTDADLSYFLERKKCALHLAYKDEYKQQVK